MGAVQVIDPSSLFGANTLIPIWARLTGAILDTAPFLCFPPQADGESLRTRN